MNAAVFALADNRSCWPSVFAVPTVPKPSLFTLVPRDGKMLDARESVVMFGMLRWGKALQIANVVVARVFVLVVDD